MYFKREYKNKLKNVQGEWWLKVTNKIMYKDIINVEKIIFS